MKKFIALSMMVACLGFFSLGCGEKPAPKPAAPPTTETPAAGDAAKPADAPAADAPKPAEAPAEAK